MSNSIILNEGLLKHTINTYVGGGYTMLIRNNDTSNMESIPFTSVSPDLSGYPTLTSDQTFLGVNTFNQFAYFTSGIIFNGGTYSMAIQTNTLTAGRTILFPNASGTIALTSDLASYVPIIRTISINGTSYDLSANRSWTIAAMTYPSSGIALSTGTAWGTSITDNSTNWNTAYTNRITSLTTTGTSGAATLVSNVLNIPNHTLAGLGGQAQLSGTGFVKASGTTISYDNSTYLTSITSANVTTALGFTPYNNTNPSGYITSSGSISGSAASVELSSGNFIYFNGSGTHNVRLSEAYGPLFNCISNPWNVQIINGSLLCGFSSTGGTYNSGNGYFSGDITAYYSDGRLKHNLNRIDNAIDKIKTLNGYTYQHNKLGQDLLSENSFKIHAGLVAQEVQKVLPEVVTIAPFDLDGYDEFGNGLSRSGENYLTIKYERIVPLLIEGIKEQQVQIENQQKQIEELKAIINVSITK